MKKLLTIIIAIALTSNITSCKKDDPNDPNNQNSAACVQNNSGTLKVDSYKKDPYKVYVNGAYKGTVNAYGLATYTLTTGTYSTKYTQASGYAFYPTEYTSSLNIEKCKQTSVQIN